MKYNGPRKSLHLCRECGKEFSAGRRHAKTCSPNCRKKLSLKRQAIYEFEVEFYKQLHALEMQVNDPDLGADAFYVLNEIHRRLCKASKRASKTDMAKQWAIGA